MKIFNLALLSLFLIPTAQAATMNSLNSLNGEFSMVDTNNDGFISKTELSGLMSGSLGVQNEQVFSNLDKDGDGFITKEEYMSFYSNVNANNSVKDGLEAKFSEIDTDKDDKISSAEMENFRRGNLNNDVDDLFTILDANGDNKITKHEFDTFFNQMKQLLNL